jgi:hypothetical protein
MNQLSKLFRRGDRTNESAAELAGPEDGVLAESVVRKLREHSRFDLLAATTADRARWFAAFLVLGGITLFSSFGWYVADNRFAENVRVAWVKLDPSGAYTVDFADQVRPVDFYQSTLESKISEFVDKRFRRSIATIVADYRFVGHFLSPQMAARFLGAEDYNAARVAAELVGCRGNCVEREVKVRVVQHRSQTPLSLPEQPVSTLNETLVFVTFTDRKVDGSIVDRRNAIVQIAWRLRSKAEIVAHKSALSANPIGIEVLSLELKEDPTPVARDN